MIGFIPKEIHIVFVVIGLISLNSATLFAGGITNDFSSLAGLTIDSGSTDNGIVIGGGVGGSNAYFGGSSPTPPVGGGYFGNAATFVAPNLTFDLAAGDVTISAVMRNSSSSTLLNESYLWFGPEVTVLGNPLADFPTVEREGILFGGASNLATYQVWDLGDSVTNDLLLFSDTPGIPLDSWFDIEATLGINASSELILTTAIDGVPTGPFNLGLASNYPWINNMRVGLGVDDLADSFSVNSAVPEPSTYALILTGFLGLGWIKRKRQNAVYVA